MVPKLLGVIEQSLDKQAMGTKTAIQLLKMVRIDAGFETDFGPVDVEEIIEQQVQKRLAEKLKERKKYQTNDEQFAELLDPSGWLYVVFAGLRISPRPSATPFSVTTSRSWQNSREADDPRPK